MSKPESTAGLPTHVGHNLHSTIRSTSSACYRVTANGAVDDFSDGGPGADGSEVGASPVMLPTSGDEGPNPRPISLAQRIFGAVVLRVGAIRSCRYHPHRTIFVIMFAAALAP